MENYGFLGGDVSKGMCDFQLLDYRGNKLQDVFQLDDNGSGHEKLYKLLSSWQKKYGISKIIVGLESTGGYENNWYTGLRHQSKKLNLEVYRINPKRIYYQTKVENRGSITDPVSATVIGNYLRKNYGTMDLVPKRSVYPDTEKSQRSLHKYIESQVRQNTRTKNQIEKLLYTYLPELLSLKSEKYSNWFLELLSRYPSRESILEAGIEGLTQINYISESKALSIVSALKNSVACPSDHYINLSIQNMALDIKVLTKKIKKLRMELAEQCKRTKADSLEIVCSIGGIGVDSGITFLLGLGDINRYEKGSNVSAFLGINPCIKQSGDKWKSKMSKQGNKTYRANMYKMAENVILYEPYFKSIYTKHVQNGKAGRQAIVAVMNKLTRVLFGMLKSNSKFDAGIDQYNQTKYTQIKHHQKAKKAQNRDIDKKRRHQQEFELAPISNRQKRKRKQEQNVSS